MKDFWAWILPILGAETFLQPIFLWGFVLLPVFWVIAWRTHNADDDTQIRDFQLLKVRHSLVDIRKAEASQSLTQNRTMENTGSWIFKQVLRTLLLLVMILAAAQPAKKLEVQDDLPTQIQRDVVFVLESSASFMLPDYRFEGQEITRMDAVKRVLQSFVASLEGNRFGLVIYAEQAYSLMPLSADHLAVQSNLQRLKSYLAGRTDEAITEALGLGLLETRSLSALNTSAAQTTTEQPKKRVVVLISDGISLKSRLPITDAINFAQQQNTPIYTIGVGAQSAAADQRQYRGLLYQSLDATPLKQIAQQTGGEYFQIGSGEDLQTVLQKIHQLEGVVLPPKSAKEAHQLVIQPLLLAAIVLFVLYFLWLLLINYVYRPVDLENSVNSAKPQTQEAENV